MSIQHINLEDLRSRGECAPSFEIPFKILKTYSATRLRTLLRHHDEDIVEGEDTERRDAFDELLAYYSLMEVASVAGYVPARLPEDYRRTALATLKNAAVRAYYERKYPLLLPRAHRERLLGTWTGREKGTDAAPLFASFTELNRMIEDEDVETFLWFLEDGSVGRYSLEDLLDIIADPERFAATLAPAETDPAGDAELWSAVQGKEVLKHPEELTRRFVKKGRKKTPAEQALHGYRKFLFFCRDLDSLLRRSSDYRLLQSAMWHYHAYWFDELSDELRPYMIAATTRFAAWNVAPEETPEWVEDRSVLVEETRRERADSVADMHAAVARLTSGDYGLVLRERFAASQRRALARAPTPQQRRTAAPHASARKTAARPAAVAAAGKKTGGVPSKQANPSKNSTNEKRTPTRSTATRAEAAKASKRPEQKSGTARKAIIKAPSGTGETHTATASRPSVGRRRGKTGRR